jgi:hypothetical protein
MAAKDSAEEVKSSEAHNQRKDETQLSTVDRSIIGEQLLLSKMQVSSLPVDLIINLDRSEEVRELALIRFSACSFASSHEFRWDV